MNKPTPSERLRYWFDNLMSRGVVALIGLLGVITLLFVAVMSAIVVLFQQGPADDPHTTFFEAMWLSLMRTLDPGTMGADQGPEWRAMMLVVTIGGLIVVASLIGVVSNAFDSKVEQLRKGRSRVLENDHTLILGWSSKIFPVITELVVANESRRKATIVVLADGDKVDMEDELNARVTHRGKTKIIVRSGDPMSLTDLELASPHAARSIVILAPEDHADPDSVVVKTALAVTNNPNRKAENYHVVAELQDPSYLEAAQLVGRDEVQWVVVSDLTSRITVQSCRQSGLSIVFSELLSFEGDEVYFTVQQSLVGKTYHEAQFSFVDSSVFGLVSGGVVTINPPSGTVIGEGDQLILVAEDDSTIKLAASVGVPDTAAISSATLAKAAPESTLVLGYNTSLHVIVKELAEYVVAGSSVTVLADAGLIGGTPSFESYKNLTIGFEQGDTTDRATLEKLDVSSFDHVIVLAYRDDLDLQLADTKTLITLLHLRDIEVRAGLDLNIVSEMLDDRNRELAEVTKPDDFIVSDKLVSLMLSQVSENIQLTDVFSILFSAQGSELYLRPASHYVAPGSTVDFFTVVEAASRQGESAIGYFSATSGAVGGVRINPRKTDTISFQPGDKIIVLSEA